MSSLKRRLHAGAHHRGSCLGVVLVSCLALASGCGVDQREPAPAGAGAVGGATGVGGAASGGGPQGEGCSADEDCQSTEFCNPDSALCEYCAPGRACSSLPLSQHLSESDTVIDFVERSARFWFAARDEEMGGFFSHVQMDGTPLAERADRRSLVGQSRIAYGMVRAFMLTGEEEFLDQAEHALAFHYAHGWDEEHDGWHFFTDRNGDNPRGSSTGMSPSKWSYFQHYGLLGPSVMCEATRSELDCGWMDRGIDSLTEHLWDDRVGLEGYYSDASADFSVVSGKGFTPTADAITTHALTAFLITQSDEHRARFLTLADNLADRLVASRQQDEVRWGFAEEFDADWKIDTSRTFGFVGHVFKTAWCLARAYQIDPQPRYREAARELLQHMVDDGGFDREVGAPNDTFFWDQGLDSTTKEYWQVEQGFTAGVTNFFIAESEEDRATFLDVGDRSLSFLLDRMVDEEHGEIVSRLSTDGTMVLSAEKGGDWKAAYHSTETGYYAYLYGKLLVQREPARLYYRFETADEEREFKLWPLALADDGLAIESVRHGGGDWSGFDADSRSLRLPPGAGGVFEVWFTPTW